MKKIITFMSLVFIIFMASCNGIDKDPPIIIDPNPNEIIDKVDLMIEKIKKENNHSVKIDITLVNRGTETVYIKIDDHIASYEDFNDFEIYVNEGDLTTTYSRHGEIWTKTLGPAEESLPIYNDFKDEMFDIVDNVYTLKPTYLGVLDSYFSQSYDWFNLKELSLEIKDEMLSTISYRLNIENFEMIIFMKFYDFNTTEIQIPAIS